MEDAIALGGMLLAILRNAGRVEIACLSELVNCISHIRTSNGGGAWVLPPYYTFLLYSKYGRGTSLLTSIDSPKYDSADFTDVPYLDAGAVMNDNGDITVFAINRSLDETLPVEIDMRGFGSYNIEKHIVLESENAKDTNTEECPNRVAPRNNGNAQMDGGKVRALLPKLSWNVIRLNQVK